MTRWPETAEELAALQSELAARADAESAWTPPDRPLATGGTFFASPTRDADDRSWAAAVVLREGVDVAAAVARGAPGGPYVSGLLALREGRLLEEAIRALPVAADVLLVNASGRDHPRRAGLALHLGAALGVPTVGVTDRPLVGEGPEPGEERGASAPLTLGGELVGYRVRSRRGAKLIIVHAAWRTDPNVALDVVLRALGRARTPEPLRRARRLARVERARDEGRLPPGWQG